MDIIEKHIGDMFLFEGENMQKANIIETNLDFDSLYARECTDMLVIHHTGNSVDDDMSARQIHMSHKNNGWSGIGYHYVVRKDGSIERGRPHWAVGAHAYGENWHTIGVHVCDNFELVEPSKRQIEGEEGADKILDYYRASKGAFLCI